MTFDGLKRFLKFKSESLYIVEKYIHIIWNLMKSHLCKVCQVCINFGIFTTDGDRLACDFALRLMIQGAHRAWKHPSVLLGIFKCQV